MLTVVAEANNTGRNADWSRDETILLLDLYLRHPDAEARHPQVVKLSETLRALAYAEGRPHAENFRNPVGIAMKLRNLAQQDPAFQRSGKAGLGHGNRLNAEVWALLADDPFALAAQVERIRQGLPPTTDVQPGVKPSRGPAPSFGSYEVARADGGTDVYVLILDGTQEWPVARLPVPAGAAVLKVGFSNDIQRRLGELNAGLPIILGIRWQMLWSAHLPTGLNAYETEQAVLRVVHERGWSGANEFIIAPADALIDTIRAMLPGFPDL